VPRQRTCAPALNLGSGYDRVDLDADDTGARP
jgi:hypothetical protein